MAEDAQAALVEYVRAPMYGRKNSPAQHGPLSEAPQNVLALLFDCVCGLLLERAKWASGL